MAQDAAKVPAGAALEVTSRLGAYTVVSVQSASNRRYEGRKIDEIAAQSGRTAVEAMLDIAIEDRLETLFAPDYGGHDRASFELRGRIWADDRTLVGASDAGAHLDLIDSFAFATVLLQKGVREHGVIGLEEAVRQITLRPATYFGLVDRGRIEPGCHADLVVFDPETVGRGPTYQRYDVPGGADYRLYADARGVDHVFVNGAQIVRNGEHTGALPGTVLRSGRDTRTVSLDALREPRAALSA
jgi:N-acyl-D-aspartate/D-glutamate deacylase